MDHHLHFEPEGGRTYTWVQLFPEDYLSLDSVSDPEESSPVPTLATAPSPGSSCTVSSPPDSPRSEESSYLLELEDMKEESPAAPPTCSYLSQGFLPPIPQLTGFAYQRDYWVSPMAATPVNQDLLFLEQPLRFYPSCPLPTTPLSSEAPLMFPDLGAASPFIQTSHLITHAPLFAPTAAASPSPSPSSTISSPPVTVSRVSSNSRVSKRPPLSPKASPPAFTTSSNARKAKAQQQKAAPPVFPPPQVAPKTEVEEEEEQEVRVTRPPPAAAAPAAATPSGRKEKAPRSKGERSSPASANFRIEVGASQVSVLVLRHQGNNGSHPKIKGQFYYQARIRNVYPQRHLWAGWETREGIEERVKKMLAARNAV